MRIDCGEIGKRPSGAETLIITLSRQFAAGARTIAQELGGRLGYRVLDANLEPLIARQLSAPEAAVAALDEHLEPLAIRVLNSLGASAAESSVLPADGTSRISADAVEHATADVIAALALEESLIIVGRGARWVLGDRGDALHVRLVAPVEVRIARVVKKQGIDHKSAERLVHSTDHDRAASIHRYFNADWNDPDNYHLTINTGLLSAQQSTDVIVDAADSLRSERRSP